MRIKVKFNEAAPTTFKAKFKDQDAYEVRFRALQSIYERYEGEYTVTPQKTSQTLYTEGLIMSGNIVVNPIPNNYGLVTYNGFELTVS